MMVVHVRMQYLEKLKDMSYRTTGTVPVLLNMDVLNPIGWCTLIPTEDEEEEEAFYGYLFLDRKVDVSLYFYYLREAKDKECFCFAGINLSEKKLRHTYPCGKVIPMPLYAPAIQRSPKRLYEVALGGI